MRDVAIVAFAQSDCMRDAGACNEVELIMPVLQAVYKQAGISSAQEVDSSPAQVAVTTSRAPRLPLWQASMLWVPCRRSKNLTLKWMRLGRYTRSWLKIQMGGAESALIYGFGKSSPR